MSEWLLARQQWRICDASRSLVRERTRDLFPCELVQLMACCRNAILAGKAPDTIWTQDTVTVLTSMEACMKVNEQYQLQYKATKEKLMETPKGRQFEFAEDQVCVAVLSGGVGGRLIEGCACCRSLASLIASRSGCCGSWTFSARYTSSTC